MLDTSIIEVFRDSLIKNGFRREFIDNLSDIAVLTLYDLWDVEDDEEQITNVNGFIKEYGFNKEEVFQ